MAKNIFTLLIFSIAVVFTGCSVPIGSLLADSPLEFIRVEPKRFVYASDEYFKPADEDEGVDVYGIFGGKQDLIPIKDVKITISGYPVGDAPIVLNESQKFEGYDLTQLVPGTQTIEISYRGKETSYRISVGETETGDGDNGNGKGITIGWEWPDD